MSISKLSVKVLSASVKSESDVFDHLVEVQRLDTNEVGTLLCSHCCRWPAALKDQATWLEGCYTPKTMKEDNRLLMGYHPNTMTTWKYREEADGIYVDLSVKASTRNQDENEEEIEIDAFYPLECLHDFPGDIRNMRHWRTISRIWEQSQNDRESISAIQAYFRSTMSMVDNGLIDSYKLMCMSAMLPNFTRIIEELNEAYYINWSRGRAVRYYGCEVYANCIEAMLDFHSEGYMSAWEIEPTTRYTHSKETIVSHNSIVRGAPGYYPAVRIGNIVEDPELGLIVEGYGPDMAPAISLNTVDTTPLPDGTPCLQVETCLAIEGYWRAENI